MFFVVECHGGQSGRAMPPSTVSFWVGFC